MAILTREMLVKRSTVLCFMREPTFRDHVKTWLDDGLSPQQATEELLSQGFLDEEIEGALTDFGRKP